MVTIKLYVVESAEDAIEAESLNLIEFTADDNECDSCDTAVGFVNGRFFHCVICIEGDDVWLTCIECAYGIVYPGE